MATKVEVGPYQGSVRASRWTRLTRSALFGVAAACLRGAGSGAAAPEMTLPFVVVIPSDAPATPVTLWVGSADGGERTISLAPGAREGAATVAGVPPWRLRLLAAGFWGPTRSVSEAPSTPVPLELWPAGELALEVDTGASAPPPGRLGVFLTPAQDDASGPGAAEVHCPVEGGKVAGCELPAGVWHLRLEMGQLAPHLAWDVTVPPGAQLNLGRVTFRPGATLTGTVVAPPGVAVEATTVHLSPARDAAALGGEVRRGLAAAGRQVAVDGAGRFAVAGVPGGAWVLLAHHPSCPAPPLVTTVHPPSGVMELPQAITLRCPATVEVRVTPADSVPEGGLKVELLPWGLHEPSETPLASGIVSHGGRWRSPPLPPARMLVVLSSPADEVLASREVELEGEDLAVEIPLELVVVDGKLMEGRKGLAARLDFRAPDGATAAAQSDHEGRFSAIFPRSGRWQPFVTLGPPRQVLALPPVEVTAGGTLTLRLPHTRVRGEVRHADGVSPAPGAEVEITGAEGSPLATGNADSSGRFELRAVPPGRALLTARQGERSSRPWDVDVVEGRESHYVVLLEDRITVRLQVVAGEAPVVGAQVFAGGADAAGRVLLGEGSVATTGPDGVATLTLPPGTARVALLVLAPGFPLYDAPPQPLPAAGEVIQVSLAPAGGTLLLDPDAHGEDRVPLLLKDGHVLQATPMLGHWAALHGKPPRPGQEWEIPMMPPARYRLCRATQGEVAAVLSGAALPRASACSSEGFLAPGGVLRLSLP